MKVGANLVEIYRKQSCSIKILIVLNTSTAKTIASNLGKNTAPPFSKGSVCIETILDDICLPVRGLFYPGTFDGTIQT